MLQIIKQVTKNFFNPFGKLEWGNGYEEGFTMINGKVEEGAFLTAAELQYLRKIVADKINGQEGIRGLYLADAKYYKDVKQDVQAKYYFKQHRNIKAELKKLVKIQQKIKHSLITMG